MNNRLLIASGAALLVYFIPSLFVPNRVVSGTTSLLLLSAGLLVMWRYGRGAYDIVFRGLRGTQDDAPGAHLAGYGTFLIAAGACYQGCFGLMWIFMGQPMAWTGTPFSGFGRYLMFWGFWLMLISPDIHWEQFRLRKTLFWLVAIWLAIAVGFILGRQGVQEHGWLLPIPRVQCKAACAPPTMFA